MLGDGRRCQRLSMTVILLASLHTTWHTSMHTSQVHSSWTLLPEVQLQAQLWIAQHLGLPRYATLSQ